MSHEDGLGEELDEGTRLFWEPAVGGLIVVDHEVVRGVTFGADERSFEGAVEAAAGEFAYGVGAGTYRCNPEVHCSSGYHRAGTISVGHTMMSFPPFRLIGRDWTEYRGELVDDEESFCG